LAAQFVYRVQKIALILKDLATKRCQLVRKLLKRAKPRVFVLGLLHKSSDDGGENKILLVTTPHLSRLLPLPFPALNSLRGMLLP
jgi:hypothetical protein